MSAFRSWLPPSGVHRATHELPLYHSPPTSPPPGQAAESIHASTLRLQHARETPTELLALERKATELQERLQHLVDAQSEALLAVNGPQGATDPELDPELGDFPDYLDDADNSSLTGTAWSTPSSRSPAGRGHRLPPHVSGKPKSLHSTRHNIYKTMLRLSRLKSREHELLTPQLSSHTANLHRIDTWDRQKSRIARAASELQFSPDGRRAQELGEEVDRVDQEIEELQTRLNQLKSQRDRLDDEHQKLLNRLEAQQAKFRREEQNVEAEVRDFVGRAPENLGDGAKAIWNIKPERRTLEMAKDYWEWRLEGSERRVKAAEREEDALKDGAQIWRQVVERVNEFERSLRESLQAIAASTKPGANMESVSKTSRSIQNAMDEVASYLEEQHEVSIQKGWNLLITCIGAELEAFRQAQDVLGQTLQTLQQTELSELPSSPFGKGLRRRSKRMSQPVSDASTATVISPSKQVVISPLDDDSEDADPDPDLLISHLDTDPES
ncbi:hypothetical protein P152DRAFT_426520 [Eremomyces bilateralis CBS 781.70]|uniref:Autophagy-related protein 28 n=1 Tax=Eremomyces bilateralis CBS 781.70 TaxID=1392243 RepID=A0A6G1GG29_9PEZI|nr:uncharacterized protein P152DRAFT_426520 [Eremomyces bilateralis CBS 781.70]KAF1817028.1 hypothetical protein P152DRAFT_426520 [Eremomyces bilateralis CBS 781.70]